ncbi:MAG: ATP-binding cassette domain-containing protein, partial [Mesorhizobium sp.]
MTEAIPLVVQSLFMHDLNGREIVSDVSLHVKRGEVLAIIGESGSGKTSVALSLLGFARPGMRISSGNILIGGTDILSLSGRRKRAFQGGKV